MLRLFFAVDGPTGVGKSAVMGYLMQNLKGRLPQHLANRIVFVKDKDSEESPLPEQIRELMRAGVHEFDGSEKAKILMFWASRIPACKKLVRLIKEGKIPIVSRFGASTWAHQIFYHDLVEELDALHWDMVKHCVVDEGLFPPHYIMLTTSPEILERRIAHGPKGERFPRACEKASRIEFLRKLTEGYERYLDHGSQHGTIVNATEPVEVTGEGVIEVILDRFRQAELIESNVA